MLRIAVVTRYFPSSAEPWQGRSAYQILRALARSADVRIFFPNASYPPFLKPRSRIYSSLDMTFCPADLKVTYRNYPALPMVSRPLNGWMARRTLLPDVRSFGPDIILGIFLYPEAFAALQIGKMLCVPVVVKAIGSDINRIGDWTSAMLTRTVLKGADFVLAVSDDLLKKAVAMGVPPEKARTIHNGCDLAAFCVRDRMQARQTLQIDLATEAVIYIGRMDLKKGLRELVEAAASLHSQRPKMHVYLVGEGPDRPLIESAVVAANAASFVHVAGPCSPGDVPVWMAAADVVTLPSYMEGCPNVVLEALACGRPVVATHVGGIPEILDERCGRLVAPRDSGALAEALASVLDRTWDADSISTNMSRSWDSVASELLEILEALVSTHYAKGNAPLHPNADQAPNQ